jgi:hypothetical protein
VNGVLLGHDLDAVHDGDGTREPSVVTATVNATDFEARERRIVDDNAVAVISIHFGDSFAKRGFLQYHFATTPRSGDFDFREIDPG